MPDDAPSGNETRALAAAIVSAYVRRNEISADQMPVLITTVHQALSKLRKRPETEPEERVPAVPIRKSVAAEFVVCLECGRRGKMLRGHLSAAHGLSVAAYRSRWNLSAKHPLIAPSYSAQRSVMAKEFGLGRDRAVSGEGAEATVSAPVLEVAPRRRGRPRRPSTAQPE